MLLQQLAAYTSAIFFAALIPTVIAFGITGPVNLMPYALGMSLGHAVLLGLPLFLFLQRKGWTNLVTSACAGFVIGAAPAGVVTWPSPPPGSSASVNGIPTVINGVTALAGWFHYGRSLLFLGLLGSLAGVGFWLTLKWSAPAKPAAHDAPGSQQTLRRRSMALAAIALLLTGGVAAIPAITKDRTCHNIFRDGRRTGVTPQARIGLEIDTEGWPKLIRTLEQFAAAHSLSFRNTSKSHPEVVQALYLSLCNERGVNITVHDQRCASRSYKPFGGGGVPIGVYELQAGSGWELLTRSLIGILESSWPGNVRYRDENGRVVPIPDRLR